MEGPDRSTRGKASRTGEGRRGSAGGVCVRRARRFLYGGDGSRPHPSRAHRRHARAAAAGGGGGARGEDAGAGAGNANALLPPSRVTAETPQTAISRQATELLMKQRSLDGLSFPGGFALEDVLQMVDFASGTPRAGTPLASALAASGLNGLNELALPAIPSLKTGFTPRAGSSIEEIWRQFSERGGDPGDAQPPPPVPEGGMAPGAPPGLLPVHTMAIRPGAAEVLPLPGSVEAAADLSQVNELPVSPSARRRYQAAARAARRSKRKPVSTGPDKRAAAVKRPAANVDAEGDEDDDEDEPTQKKRCIAEPTARVLNNRASARRSRERKLQYVVDLENQVENLKSELADVKQQLAEALGRNRRK